MECMASERKEVFEPDTKFLICAKLATSLGSLNELHKKGAEFFIVNKVCY